MAAHQGEWFNPRLNPDLDPVERGGRHRLKRGGSGNADGSMLSSSHAREGRAGL